MLELSGATGGAGFCEARAKQESQVTGGAEPPVRGEPRWRKPKQKQSPPSGGRKTEENQAWGDETGTKIRE